MGRTHDTIISNFDLDRLEAELAAVTEQRDRLAEALRNITEGSACSECGGGNAVWLAAEALASVKGGSDE